MREKLESIVRWASVILGALILGSCTVAGGFNYSTQHWLGGLLGFLGGVLIVAILLGWIYAYFLLRRDLKSIQTDIAKLAAGAKPDPGQR